MTNFEKALQQAREGKLQTPSVMNGDQPVDYFLYQLACHKYALSILSIGMKMRGVKLTDMKKYYGLKGRSAAECLPQLEKILADYKTSL